MKQMRQIVACLCGLLVVAQALLPLAFAMPAQTGSHTAHAPMAAADCPHCKDKDQAARHCDGNCGMSQCAHSAGCSASIALPCQADFSLASAALLKPPAPRVSGFASPDPDARLRPPTLRAA